MFAILHRVDFLTESVPERRNLHRKFQKFSGGDTPGWILLQEVTTLPNPPHGRFGHAGSRFGRAGSSMAISAMLGAMFTVLGHTVMLWGIAFFNHLRWQP